MKGYCWGCGGAEDKKRSLNLVLSNSYTSNIKEDCQNPVNNRNKIHLSTFINEKPLEKLDYGSLLPHKNQAIKCLFHKRKDISANHCSTIESNTISKSINQCSFKWSKSLLQILHVQVSRFITSHVYFTNTSRYHLHTYKF